MAQHDHTFHAGERAVQRRAEVSSDWLESAAGFVRPAMPQQHREFFENLPMLFLGLLDPAGRPWCVSAFGPPGFVASPSADALVLQRAPVLVDELGLMLTPGSSVGLVGVDLSNRRRNRMNGRVRHASGDAITLAVDQSFGNCPQYIQTRSQTAAMAEPSAATGRSSSLADPTVRRIIESADTFFIASRAAGPLEGGSAGVDASHRGGRPGFLGINDDGSLSFPDFSGNRMFNTLGNIEGDGRVGLFLPDFETGEAVVLTGRASIDWSAERAGAFAGAERIVDVQPEEIWHATATLPMTAALAEPWPALEATGSWDEVRLAALKRDGYRHFRIVSKRRESDAITSFYLTPADGGPIEPHEAGQFLPIRLHDDDGPILRSYTISQAPNGHDYRLSIKREAHGRASRWLHDRLESGDLIEVASPAGDFVLDRGTQPIVMLSGGVGITPMVAMLDGLVSAQHSGAPRREVYFIHATRNSASRAFRGELEALARQYDWLHLFTAYSAPGAEDSLGHTHDIEARLSMEVLAGLLPFGGYQFYLCGPESFMRALYSGLRDMGIDRSHIHYEFFGAGELDDTEEKAATAELPTRATVTFAHSKVQTEWTAQSGTLLETAEASGLKPSHSCRSGKCGTCATRLIAGNVHYPRKPLISPAEGHVLTCCAVPMDVHIEIGL
ncbi:pyridoxamine 5'-phosphate oxidase family protein [Billgrantia antri]|uniref:Pyridoxamine 5'-phosphate oxidase family protein n=1 Tax=Billgrantia antri TaxID=2846777 RepID=A0ABS6ZT93_9GAMM|nr:pyridoxamine 5'-phosphate oxidase family protein [Halomonas antri]MBW6393266.1 pyridoxamine 5'-phosphate oxidase family protein [Halomonas antri]